MRAKFKFKDGLKEEKISQYDCMFLKVSVR